MEKKQNSVEWLIRIVQSCIAPNYIPQEIIKQAKQMHKEEILIAYSKALPITDGVFTAIDKAHNYYNEQFGGEQC